MAVLELADVMDGADIRVVQGGRRLSFTLKAAQGLRVFGDVVRKELEGNETMQAGVLGLVHNAHAAPTEFLDDAVVRDGLADHWRESYVCGTGESMKGVDLALFQKFGC